MLAIAVNLIRKREKPYQIHSQEPELSSPSLLFPAMEPSSLAAPLIVDHEQRSAVVCKLEDVESSYNHLNPGTTSTYKTILHGLNALSGVGILSIPYALASGGWLSLALLFVISIAAFYSGLLIQRCMDVDSNIRTYPDIGDRAFGNKGRVLISLLIHAELYLVAIGFLILEGDNLQNLFPNMAVEVAGLNVGARQCFVIIVGLIILPTVWLDNLSLLSYISATGVFASFLLLASILWVGAFDGIGFQAQGTELINWRGIPTAISLYAFCYCAHPVFPTLYTSMKHKRQFSNVLLICFVLCTISYASMAVLGYLMFGSNVQSQITLNLPTTKFSSRLSIYVILVNPISKFALMITPIVNATKTWFPCNHSKRVSSFFISTSLVISAIIIALALPFYGDLMSLVGAFLSITASIILPCSCYMKITGIYKRFGFEMLVIGSVLVLGVGVLILGTYTSILQLIGHL